jgi:hypothetical protein
MTFPRVLIVTHGRINAADTNNNGLLLRSLFASWPSENVAQIYSSEDNGDRGFFSRYYQLGSHDRWLGRMFYKLKSAIKEDAVGKTASVSVSGTVKKNPIRSAGKRLFLDTGLYELIFQPRLSKEMLVWIEDFKPDIIFAQGYTLTFTWLPVMLKKRFEKHLAFLATDDWPTYLYSGQLGEPKVFTPLLRFIVKRATTQLMSVVDVPFAFGLPMADEYSARYKKTFITLSHTDNPKRFKEAAPLRFHPDGTFTILAMGYFHKFRWPLLLDANECCRLLEKEGITARVAVICSAIDPEGAQEIKRAPYIDIFDDPGNELLPCYLKGADLLFLAEGFDEGFVSAIRLSISSKSHLFMLSRRPVIVYAHPSTGVSKYAAKYHWARLVAQRDVGMLLEAVKDLLKNTTEVNRLVSCADETVKAFHLNDMNQARFINSLTNCLNN